MAGSNDHSIQKNSIIQQYMLVLEHLQVRLHMFWSDVFWFVLIWAQQIKEFSEVPAKKTREIKCINYRILKNSFSVKLIHFHFTNYLAWNFSNCLAH